MKMSARGRVDVVVRAGLCALTVAGAALLAPAAPASADTQAYLGYLEAKYISLTPDQLLTAANTTCAMIAAGNSSPVIVQALQKQIGLHQATAIDIVSATVLHNMC
jgi:hypothetical protein